MHTSTVTVAVTEILSEKKFKLLDKDIKIETTRGTGPGGQHKNTTDSCVIMTHIPTGIKAKADSRSQHENKRTARSILESRVANHFERLKIEAHNKLRHDQVGSGMRGDKIRTYRERDDIATDHRTNKKINLASILRGEIDRF